MFRAQSPENSGRRERVLALSFCSQGLFSSLVPPPGLTECDKGRGLMVVCGKERLSQMAMHQPHGGCAGELRAQW